MKKKGQTEMINALLIPFLRGENKIISYALSERTLSPSLFF